MGSRLLNGSPQLSMYGTSLIVTVGTIEGTPIRNNRSVYNTINIIIHTYVRTYVHMYVRMYVRTYASTINFKINRRDPFRKSKETSYCVI